MAHKEHPVDSLQCKEIIQDVHGINTIYHSFIRVK